MVRRYLMIVNIKAFKEYSVDQLWRFFSRLYLPEIYTYFMPVDKSQIIIRSYGVPGKYLL